MKMQSLLFLSFLFFTFSANFLLSSAQTTVPAAVLDTSGQEVRTGVNYYILPAESGNGGGVSLNNDRGARCPFIIALSPGQESNGNPLEFSSINPNDTVIRVSTDLNIKFTSTPESCPESPVWKLNGTESPLFVTVDGVEGNPRPETVSSWFKIEKDDDDDDDDGYQIRFCPSSSFCRPGVLCNFLCGNIGTVTGRGLQRLAFVNQETFKVKFIRA